MPKHILAATAVLLVTGVLQWNRSERVNDRYGAVTIYTDHKENVIAEPNTAELARLVGTKGRLVAVVKEPHESYHIGDFAHGVFPSLPEMDSVHLLGEGALFTEEAGWTVGKMIGVKPDDGDSRGLWMDIHELYACHTSVVELYFEVGSDATDMPVAVPAADPAVQELLEELADPEG